MPRPPDQASAARLRALLEALADGASMAEAVERSGVEPRDLDLLERIAGAIGEPENMASEAAIGEGAPGGDTGTRLTVHADGASRGNPGEAACAAIVLDARGEELLRRSRRLGVATNNVAEYEAVLMGLDLAAQLGAREVELRLDSELVVRQLNGQYKVKHPGLQPLYARAIKALQTFVSWHIIHIPRKENAAADKLANDALDGKA